MPASLFANSLRLFVAVSLSVFLLPAGPVQASAEMRKEMAKIAQNVKAILEEEGKTDVSIGPFTNGDATIPATGGPGITQILTEEVTKLGLKVTSPADIGVQGKFLMAEIKEPDPNNSLRTQKRMALRIKGLLVDRFGRQLTNFNLDTRISDGEFKTDVKSEDAFAQTLGVSGTLPSDGTPEERAAVLKTSIANPGSHIVGGSRLFSAEASPYAIEIICNNQPLPIALEDKLTHCDIPLASTYAIRLYNFSDYDAAVRVSIDGISLFAFSELRHAEGPKKGEPLYDSYVVPSKRFIQIAGWHRTNERGDSFLVTDIAKGAALTLKREIDKSRMGTISAQFCAAWPIGDDPPPDEPPAKKGTPRATGFGPPVSQTVTEVKRNIGILRSTVSLRYDK